MVEIDSFRYLTSANTKEDRATAVIARCSVCFEGKGCFCRIRRFDENEFVLPYFIQDTLEISQIEKMITVDAHVDVMVSR